jgi:hypothetical protein
MEDSTFFDSILLLLLSNLIFFTTEGESSLVGEGEIKIAVSFPFIF